MANQREGSMSGIIFLFALAFIAAVGGVFFYVKGENNSYSELVKEVRGYRDEIKEVNKGIDSVTIAFRDTVDKCGNLASNTSQYLNDVHNAMGQKEENYKKLLGEVEIMRVRQTSMDKAIAAIPKKVHVVIDDTVKMEIQRKPPVPNLPIGKPHVSTSTTVPVAASKPAETIEVEYITTTAKVPKSKPTLVKPATTEKKPTTDQGANK
jgi:hypothetical protein